MSLFITRRLLVTALAVAAFFTLGAGAAQARVAPENEGFVTPPAPPATSVIETISWTQAGLIAALACLVGIAATVAIQLVLRHGRSVAPAGA